MPIDEYSLTTLPLVQLCKGNGIGLGTSFFYKHQDRTFLVSNWHVFSGRNPYNGQSLHKHAATPDAFSLPLHQKELGHFSRGNILAIEDANGGPLWWQHPKGQDIDVAAMLLTDLPPDLVTYELPRPSETADMAIRVGMDCFVLGFPKGLSHEEVLPIGNAPQSLPSPMSRMLRYLCS
jgi:hypothetical protein